MIKQLYKNLSFIMVFCLLITCINPGVTVVYAAAIADAKNHITYHVSSSQGDDANDGLSPESPWRTLDKVNSMTFAPGTNILFKRGDHWNGELYINDSGASGQMIVYAPYGEGENKPVINGTGIPNRSEEGDLLWKSGSAAILVRDAEYIRIEGLGVTNMGVDKDGNPNKVEDLANGKNEKLRSGIAIAQVRGQENKVLSKIEIVDNEIYHVKGVSLRELGESQDGSEDGNMYNNAGIFLFIEGGNNLGITRIDDLLIENNYIHDTSCMGIHTQPEKGGGGYNSNPSTYNTNVRILSNHIARTGADGIIVGYTDKVLVERNVSYDAGKKSTGNRVRVIAGIWPYNSSDSVFQYNEVARTHFDRGDGMAWDSDWGTSGDLIYQYNYSHENEGGALMDCNTTDVHNWIHRYNLSVNEPGVQWTITAHEVGKIEFYNNTVYIAPGGGRLKIYAPRVSDVRMYNNIFVADTADYEEFRATGNTFVNNIVSGHEGPLFGKNTMIDDPQFMNVAAAEVERRLNNIVYLKTPGALDGWEKIEGWKLKSTSPAINRGLTVNSPKVPEALRATKDMLGNPIVGEGFDGKIDIGAFEFQGEYTGDGIVNIAPMAASDSVEVEFATTLSEGIVVNNLDGVNYELTNIKNGNRIAFDKVNLDRNAGIMILKAHVLEDTTIEVSVGDQVVGEFTIEAGSSSSEYRVRFSEEVVSGEYPVQLTFKSKSENELIKLDNFKLIPGKQGAVSVPYKYTFEKGIEGWYAVGGAGQVSVQNNKLQLTSADIYTSNIAPEVENGIVEAEITAGPNQRSTLVFRYDELTGKYMEIGFDVGNYWFISSNGLGISQEQIDASKCPTVRSGETYTLKIKYQGNHVQAFVDGVEILNKTFSGNTPSMGTVGMRKWQNSSSYTTLLDNIRINAGKISGQVTLKDTNEPVVGVKVRLEGTTYETTTDANGEYVLDTVALDQAHTVVVGNQSVVTQSLTIENDEAVVDLIVDQIIVEVNKEALINVVTAVQQLDESIYSKESWKVLQEAMIEAEQLITEESTTQEAVDAMVVKLQQAVADLEVKQKESPYKYTFDNSLEGWTSEYDNIQLTHYNNQLQVRSTNLTSRITRDLAGPILKDVVIEYKVQPEIKANGGNQRSTFVVKHDTNGYIGVGFDTDNYWFVEASGQNYDNFINAPKVIDGDTYKVKVKTIGDQVSVWVNDQKCFDQQVSGVGNITGQPGVRTWNPTVINYDDIKINFGSISGRVINYNNVPVEGEQVVLSNGQVSYTDALGYYVFDEIELENTYTVTVDDVNVSIKATLEDDVYEVEDIKLAEEIEIPFIESIENIVATAKQYEEYKLPETVFATMSNQGTQEVPVIWDGVANTTTPGAYYFEGIVENYEPKVALRLEVLEEGIVNEIIALEKLAGTIEQGNKFYLPRMVKATMSVTTPQMVNVVWEGIDTITNEVETDIPGEYLFLGNVVGYECAEKAIFKLTITHKPEIILGSYIVKYKDVNGNQLIEPKVRTGLELGEYLEYAVAINGYELKGDQVQNIHLSESQNNKEITFVYKKKSSEPSDPEDEVTTPSGNNEQKKDEVKKEKLFKVEHLIPGDNSILIDIQDHWAVNSIKKVVDLGIMLGKQENVFAPNDSLTRAEIAVILDRLLGKTIAQEDTNKFTDILGNEWYSDAVTNMYSLGVLTGYEDGSFQPSKSISRSEVISCIARVMRTRIVEEKAKDTEQDLRQFVDYDHIPEWAKQDVQWCLDKGIIIGNSEKELNLSENITRAEMATILIGLLELN